MKQIPAMDFVGCFTRATFRGMDETGWKTSPGKGISKQDPQWEWMEQEARRAHLSPSSQVRGVGQRAGHIDLDHQGKGPRPDIIHCCVILDFGDWNLSFVVDSIRKFHLPCMFSSKFLIITWNVSGVMWAPSKL